MLAMLKRALLLAGIGMAFTATAQAERPDFRADGSVRYAGKEFPTVEAFHVSPEFQQSGARCATPHVSQNDPLAFAATDCSMTGTVINQIYNDNRTLIVQVVWHIIR